MLSKTAILYYISRAPMRNRGSIEVLSVDTVDGNWMYEIFPKL